jgi:hypothetical protein
MTRQAIPHAPETMNVIRQWAPIELSKTATQSTKGKSQLGPITLKSVSTQMLYPLPPLLVFAKMGSGDTLNQIQYFVRVSGRLSMGLR